MKTFEEWRRLNFSIIKGEKSQARNKNGEPLFSDSQVRENWKKPEWEGHDYLADAEFWAKANPHMLYKQSIAQPHRKYSHKAGAILAYNLK
ncbi:MAG: hypothetical protein FMNOHCHN_03423 [Ignavibacteriaceae bacterium]|nr:hypothetical protein [Ignavibacteriaceae bacterium]